MTAHWRSRFARWRHGLEGFLRGPRGHARHNSHWVEPSNAITRAVYAGLDDEDRLALARALYTPWVEPREFAPENVLIAAPPPRAQAEEPPGTATAAPDSAAAKSSEGHAA